ncbi:hypothetical protein GOP47_0007175 [Adiantum capillus-veneris]|uniref:GDSL esterase/lipase n=1 Tax=Adiantum capillus-veneris TaxID=13818 RepID=A0A9D4ZL98_ADICA|nr:hypothetical protein GOP47_0007175 [Adiantum capillus-veneris]
MDHPAAPICSYRSLRVAILRLRPILLVFLVSSFQLALAAGLISTSSPPLFILGASMVDAGQNAVAMPHRSYADFDPYGSDYFGKPVGRWSNGRNLMDFITEGLGYGHIPAYLRSIGLDFTYGVNFASSGSTAANSTAVGNSSGGLFCLLVQVDQFRDFQDTILSSHYGLEQTARLRQRFSDAIYFFETGNNDYHDAKDQFGDSLDINATVTTTIAAMKVAFQTMYGLGARTFIIMNATPTGCSPASLTSVDDDEELDENNCDAIWTNIVQAHNKRLIELLDELRDNYPAAEWVLFDAYSIFMDGYLNSSKYGILYPFKSCCGAGGTYNFNANVMCGRDAQYINGTLVEWTKCENPKLHLSWDGIHPVESFAYYIAQGVLNGTHLIPSFSLKERVHSSVQSVCGQTQGRSIILKARALHESHSWLHSASKEAMQGITCRVAKLPGSNGQSGCGWYCKEQGSVHGC